MKCLTILSLLFSLPAFAGGVSDGGGGTTNPHPADPQWVVTGAVQYAQKNLLVWLNAEEGNFGRMSQEEQAKSPFRKLFLATPNVFEVVKHAKIDLNMSAPCRDKNGTPWDGSMYANEPGAICISPFTMAPKLNEMNVYPETMALVMHELSHLMGTNEDEAQEIQQHALWALSKQDPIDTMVAIDVLTKGTSDLNAVIFLMDAASNPANQLRPNEVESFWQDLLRLRDRLQLRFLSAELTREATINHFSAQFMRLQVLGDQVNAQDTGASEESRRYYADRLEKDFRGQSSASAAQIEANQYDFPRSEDPYMNSVIIQKPVTPALVAGEMRAVHDFVVGVRAELEELAGVKAQVTVNK